MCASWSSLCKHQSGRSREFPLGNSAKQWVRKGNDLMLITGFGCLLCHLVQVFFVVEAPAMSVMDEVPWMKMLFELSDCEKVVEWLGFFGAKSAKPIKRSTRQTETRVHRKGRSSRDRCGPPSQT